MGSQDEIFGEKTQHVHITDNKMRASTTYSDGTVNGNTAIPEHERVQKGSAERYSNYCLQFSNIIMIATFSGGVVAAVLSFMNDVLTDRVGIWKDTESQRILYSTYSLGLMLGLIAIALNITVAAIAAVNAALACHFSIHPPEHHEPSMEARIVFCMVIQFMAAGVAGISLVLLSLHLDLAFAIVGAILLLTGIVVSAYHLLVVFGSEWLSKLKTQPLHVISLVLSLAAFIFNVSTPSPSSWWTITTFGFTIVYHILAVFHNKSAHGDRPRQLALFLVLCMALTWVGCAIVTKLLQGQSGHWSTVEVNVVCALSGAEAIVLLLIGIYDGWRMYRYNIRSEQNNDSSPS